MVKRVLVHLVPLVALTLAAGCNAGPEPPPVEQTPRDTQTVGPDLLRFTVVEDGLRQSLELIPRDGGGFDAAIKVAGTCSRAEAGAAAVVEAEGDVDVSVDPDGEGHPTDAFALTVGKTCEVTIRLSAPEREYAWLRESDCANECALSRRAMTRE